jgi:hypothetical protein
MATPPSAATFAALFRAEGVNVVEVGDWEHHNRNTKGPWGPVHGVMIHHTVTKGTANTVAIVRDGYADLPGPLCHGMIAKNGTVHLVGYGRANHAGLGDPDVLRPSSPRRPRPSTTRPRSTATAPSTGSSARTSATTRTRGPRSSCSR